MMIKKNILIVFSLFVTSIYCSAQKDSTFYNQSFKDRLLFGGGLGLNIGTITMIEASPMVGYYFTPRIVGGIRASYQYLNIHNDNWRFETSTYGGGIFGRYYAFEYLFAHAEYEILNIQEYDLFSGYPKDGRVNIESAFAGIGYREEMGFGYITIMALYNFTPTLYTPYSNPLIRVGIEF